MKLKVPLIPSGIPSEKLPCPIGYTMNTADVATMGAEKAKYTQGRISRRKLYSYSLPNYANAVAKKCSTTN